MSDPSRTLSHMDNDDLVAAARPIVWRRGYQAGLSPEDREDLLQDVLIKYVQVWPDGESPDNVEAYVRVTPAYVFPETAKTR